MVIIVSSDGSNSLHNSNRNTSHDWMNKEQIAKYGLQEFNTLCYTFDACTFL